MHEYTSVSCGSERFLKSLVLSYYLQEGCRVILFCKNNFIGIFQLYLADEWNPLGFHYSSSLNKVLLPFSDCDKWTKRYSAIQNFLYFSFLFVRHLSFLWCGFESHCCHHGV